MMLRPTEGNFFAAVKSFDANITISGNFVLNANNSHGEWHERQRIKWPSHRSRRLTFENWSGKRLRFHRTGVMRVCYLRLTSSLSLSPISSLSEQNIISLFLPSSTKLRQGNVFTPVCQSFCSQGGVCHLPPGQTSPYPVHDGIHTLPAECMLGYGQQAGGKHPTEMHSCLQAKT